MRRPVSMIQPLGPIVDQRLLPPPLMTKGTLWVVARETYECQFWGQGGEGQDSVTILTTSSSVAGFTIAEGVLISLSLHLFIDCVNSSDLLSVRIRASLESAESKSLAVATMDAVESGIELMLRVPVTANN